MSFDLVPQLIIVISTAIIIIIFGKNIPKATDANDRDLSTIKETKEEARFNYLYSRLKKRISREEYQKRIDSLWRWIEKFLRKIRISFLKLDNKIVLLLSKLREKNVETDIDKNTQTDNMEECDEAQKEIPETEIAKAKEAETDNEKVFSETNETSTETKETENIDQPDEGEKSKSKTQEQENGETMTDINLKINKKNTKGKEKEYIEMIMKNPIDIKAYWKLGIVYSRRNNYHDAISCFRQISKIDPTYTKAKKKVLDLIDRMKKKEKETVTENAETVSKEEEKETINIKTETEEKKESTE